MDTSFDDPSDRRPCCARPRPWKVMKRDERGRSLTPLRAQEGAKMTALEAEALVTPLLLLATILLSPLPHLILSICSRKAQHAKSAGRRGMNDGEVAMHVEQDVKTNGFIVPAQIHHARMTPRNAQHSFKYPSIYFAFELHALEKGQLDCSMGFRWSARGRRPGLSMTRLHPDDFGRKTFPDASSQSTNDLISTSVLYKLIYELRFRNYLSIGPQDFDESGSVVDGLAPWNKEIGQVWAIAMPSVFGLAGFNPLTVYYVYRPAPSSRVARGPLWLAVLEVHNTFNERHTYICEANKDEDEELTGKRRKGYDHCWTFAREFHVSPFNDRLGYYQLFLRDMWDPSFRSKSPVIDIRLLLLEPDEGTVGRASLHKKLLATLTSSQATSATQKPVREAVGLCTSSVMLMLLQQPFDLFLPVARIMKEAAILHWKRKLPVHIRPEPQGEAMTKGDHARMNTWPSVHNPVEQSTSTQASGDIYWNDESFIEQRCRKAIETQLRKVTLIMPEASILIRNRNAETDDVLFAGGQMQRVQKNSDVDAALTIHTLSSALYVDLCLFVPTQALLFGSTIERGWKVDSIESFHTIFQSRLSSDRVQSSMRGKIAHSLRTFYIRWAVQESLGTSRDGVKQAHGDLLIKTAGQDHPLDQSGYSVALLVAMILHIFIVLLTAGASKLFHVHYVRPPWAQVGEGLASLSQSPQPAS